MITGSSRSYLWCIEFSRVESRELATACCQLRLIQGEQLTMIGIVMRRMSMQVRVMRKMSMLVKLMRRVSMLVKLMRRTKHARDADDEGD